MKLKSADEENKGEGEFRELIENISDGVVALDKEWRIVYINRVAAKRLTREPKQLIGKIVWEEFPDTIGKPFYDAYHQAFSEQKTMSVEGYATSVKTWIRASIYPSPNGLSIFFHDITEKKEAQNKAQESENKYRQLLDRITDGFIALDKDFCYIYANQKVGELVGIDPETLIGKNVWDVFPDAVGSYTYKSFQTAMKEQRFITNVDYYEPLQLWQENYIYPSANGLSVFIKDISEKKRLERELQIQEKRQRMQIIATALEAQERERTYIGQELHDNVNQIITATKLMLALVRDNVTKDPELINLCIGNLEKAIEENRKLAHELVTPHFSDVNLVEELSTLLRTMLDPKGVRTSIDVVNFQESLLDEQRKLTLFRIVQEQCTNISKHAKASVVNIVLTTTESNCLLIVADNGKGAHAGRAMKGIGLKNIEGRLQIFNGEMKVVSQPGKGFSLEVVLPLFLEK